MAARAPRMDCGIGCSENLLHGQFLDQRGRSHNGRSLFARFGISPPQGDHPEDAQGLLDVVLPGFCPAVYPFVRDCLSRTSRPPKQTGTLDAHFIWNIANAVPNASRLPRAHECCGKHRGLSDVPTTADQGGRCREAPSSHYQRAIADHSASDSRANCWVLNLLGRQLQHPIAAPSLRGSLAPWNPCELEYTIAPA
jgi:hypothetical protein